MDGIRAAQQGRPALAGDGRTVEVRALSYGPADTYGTSWAFGCLTDSLRSGDVVPVCVAHDKSRIVGKVAGWREHDDGLYLTLRLADPEAVPEARAMQSLLRDGMVPGVSIRFADAVSRPDPRQRGVIQFTRAKLVEVSFVVDPSVPGAKVLAMRSRGDADGLGDEPAASIRRIDEIRADIAHIRRLDDIRRIDAVLRGRGA